MRGPSDGRMGACSNRTSVAVALALVLAMVLTAFAVAPSGVRAASDTVSWVYYGSISATSGFHRNLPAVVSDGVEAVYVFYATTQTASGATNINVTKLSIGTGLFGTPDIVFDTQVNDVANVVASGMPLSAAIGPEGNLYVAWTRLPTGGLGLEVYVSTSTDGGVTWLPAVRANAPNAYGDDMYPSIATAADGTVYVAWSQMWFPSVNVTVSQSTNAGNSFTGYTNASAQGSPGWALYPSLAVDSGGRVYMAYWGFDIFAGTMRVNLTWSDDGTSWTAPLPFTESDGMALYPQLLVDHADRVHLFWYDYRSLLSMGQMGVWHSMSTDRGATWTFGSPISDGVAAPNDVVSVAAHLDEIVVTWVASAGPSRGLSSVISTDGGRTWGPEVFRDPGAILLNVRTAADQNGTFYAAATDASGTYDEVAGLVFNGPPSVPVLTSVARGTASLTVAWSASPERDVVGYEVYRSPDGVNFEYVAAVDEGTTSYLDSGLANGTYWYAVAAVDDFGTSSDLSRSMSGTVGPTVQELIDALNAQIDALQAQLDGVNASNAAEVDALQAQVTALQTALTALTGSQATSNAAMQQQLADLQQSLTDLQAQLNSVKDVQTQQATQTFDYVHLGFEALVVALLGAILLLQLRRPRSPKAASAPPKREEEL